MSRDSELPAEVVAVLHRHGIAGKPIWAPARREGALESAGAEARTGTSGGGGVPGGGPLRAEELVEIGAYLAMARLKGELRGGDGKGHVVALAARCVRLGLSAEMASKLPELVERAARKAGVLIRLGRRKRARDHLAA